MAGAAINRWFAVPVFAAFGDPTQIATDKERLKNPLPFPGFHFDFHRVFEWWQHTKHIPLKLADILVDMNALDATGSYHKHVTRYLGVGGMLIWRYVVADQAAQVAARRHHGGARGVSRQEGGRRGRAAHRSATCR